VIQVENYLYGTSQMAQTTLRSVCGQAELDQLLAEREHINQKLQEIIDSQTEPWGVKVRASEESALQLRYLQTLAEIATENNSTTIFPIPIDILRPFYEAARKARSA